eukprot:964938_1
MILKTTLCISITFVRRTLLQVILKMRMLALNNLKCGVQCTCVFVCFCLQFQPFILCTYSPYYSHERVVTVDVLKSTSLAPLIQKYFADSARTCTGINKYDKRKEYVAPDVSADHLNGVLYHADCHIISDRRTRKQCSKCATAQRRITRSTKANDTPISEPKSRTSYDNYTHEQLLDKVRKQALTLKQQRKQLNQYENHQYQYVLDILHTKKHTDMFDEMISMILNNYSVLFRYFTDNNDMLFLLYDQFRAAARMVHNKADDDDENKNPMCGMRWNEASKLFALYARIHLSVYQLIKDSKLMLLPSLRTLDPARQKYVINDGMTDKLIDLWIDEFVQYCKQRGLDHVPYWIAYVDEMSVQPLLSYNPSNGAVHGQISSVHEESMTQSIINLLHDDAQLAPNHSMLQINFADARSGFYFPGPSFGSKNGWKGHELTKILQFHVFRKLWQRMPEWKVRVIVMDCAEVNENFVIRSMGLKQAKLNDQDVLSFMSPFGAYDVHVLWCGDHVAKSVRNHMANSHTKSRAYKRNNNDFPIKYNNEPVNWNYLLKMVEMCECSVEMENFGLLKRLTRRAVEVSTSFDRMRMNYYLAVTSDDTLAALKQLMEDDETKETFEGAQPLYDMLSNLAGIFNGIMIAPRSAPQNNRVFSIHDAVFEKQRKHLKWFEQGEKSNPDHWLPNCTYAHLKQLVHTTRAVAKAFFDDN